MPKVLEENTDRALCATLKTIGGWCKSEKAALKKAKACNAPYVIHSPGNYMYVEGWIVATPKD